MKTIPPDSTVETVWPDLTHRKQYVSGALQKMRQCAAANGNARIKIGVTGTGQKPYYRVFYISDVGVEEIFGSFYDNHDPLEIGFAQTDNWSTKSMSLTETLDFYAQAIGFTGKRI